MRHRDHALSLRVLIALAAACAVLSAGRARAQDALEPCDEAARGRGERIVDLTLWSSGAAASAVEEVVRELVERLGLEICLGAAMPTSEASFVEPPAELAPALARVAIARTRRALTVYVVDRSWERVLVREVPLPDGQLDEIAREQVGHIVHATMEALLAGRPIGVRRGELVRAPAIDVDTPAPASGGAARASPEVALAYALRLLGTADPIAHEGNVALVLPLGPGALQALVRVAIGYRGPAALAITPLRVDVQAAMARAEIGARLWLARDVALVGTLGIGADVLFVSSGPSLAPEISPRASQVRALPRAFGGIAVHVRLASFAAVEIGLEAQVDLLDERHVVRAQTGESIVVADPWLVSPALWAGLVLTP